jgi:hypothetical protein
MTGDASMATMGSKPAYPRQPPTVRLALLGAFTTAVLAGPVTMAGGFMGALHWLIAIRPRRRWRLFQERERAALLAME